MIRNILCFGDSNTHGFPPEAQPEDRFSYDERWPGVLAGVLGPQWRVVEEGLGGRTTVRDDPVEGSYRNGRAYLLPCLLSHRPIDVIALMLGTNDLKARFNISAWDVAAGLGVLIDLIRTAGCGRGALPPGILIIAPPVIEPTTPMYREMFAGGCRKSRKLAKYYMSVADAAGAEFFDAGQVATVGKGDGVHLDREGHTTLGQAIGAKVNACWS
jgi:lysophospholipase L1-like esterase